MYILNAEEIESGKWQIEIDEGAVGRPQKQGIITLFADTRQKAVNKIFRNWCEKLRKTGKLTRSKPEDTIIYK